MTNREVWLSNVKNNLSERDVRLLDRASKLLQNNIYSPSDKQWGNYRFIVPSLEKYLGVWNWDSAFHALAVSRWDAELAYEQCDVFLKFQKENGMFIDLIDFQNNRIGDGAAKPPVFPWAFVTCYKRKKDTKRLSTAYYGYKKNAQAWEKYRCTNGLFHYGCEVDPPIEQYAKCESGWDTSVRFDSGVFNLWAIDLNCFMIMAYDALEFLAGEMQLAEEQKMWAEKRRTLAERINARLWNDKEKTYCDAYSDTGAYSAVLSPACFMPLYTRIASTEQAESMRKIAKEKFFPGMPTVSYDHPSFDPSDYWRGPMWLNTSYWALKGLKNYGHTVIAEQMRQTILDWCDKETNCIYEYYHSMTGKGLGATQFGWSAAFIIELILDF